MARRTKKTTRATSTKAAGTTSNAVSAENDSVVIDDAEIVSETLPSGDDDATAAQTNVEGPAGDQSVGQTEERAPTDETASDAPSDAGAVAVADGGADGTLGDDSVTQVENGAGPPDDPSEDTVMAASNTDDPAEGDTTSGDDAAEEISAETHTKTDETPAPVPPVAPAPSSSGPSFVPLVLGGLIAGAIGYFIATLGQPEAGGADDRIAALEADLAALQAGEPGSGPDLTALETAQVELATRVSALESAVSTETSVESGAPATGASTAGLTDPVDLGGLDAEIAAVAVSVDALSGDLAALRAQVDGAEAPDLAPLIARVDEIEAALAARSAQTDAAIADLRAQAAAGTASAEAVARASAREQLALAVESGLPYGDVLAALPDAPDALKTAAEAGVPTSAALAREFPPLARVALRVARAETTDGAGLGSLAGRFLNARSLAPREGDDPDAVLSRAEAAVAAGDVETALTELSLLPEAARAPLSDWISRAEARSAVQAALNTYLQDG